MTEEEIQALDSQEEVETTDYKSLAEEAEERARIAEERKEKAESRFKKTAKELNELKSRWWATDSIDVKQLVADGISEEMYYLQNPIAKEFKNDIQKLKKDNNLSTEDAYT